MTAAAPATTLMRDGRCGSTGEGRPGPSISLNSTTAAFTPGSMPPRWPGPMEAM